MQSSAENNPCRSPQGHLDDWGEWETWKEAARHAPIERVRWLLLGNAPPGSGFQRMAVTGSDDAARCALIALAHYQRQRRIRDGDAYACHWVHAQRGELVPWSAVEELQERWPAPCNPRIRHGESYAA